MNQMLVARPHQETTTELLSRLWQRSMPVLCSRLDLLEAAAAAACRHSLPHGLRTDAIMEAHKRAGSLGMFGYTSGTELAREIEALLEAPGTPHGEILSKLTRALRHTLFPRPSAAVDRSI